MKIVTSAYHYLDIDGYAGCAAYAALLNRQGQPAVFASTSLLNESITPPQRSIKTGLRTDYEPSSTDTFTIIDVSDPEHFDPIVSVKQVETVIDHHPGFEAFWRERINDHANIEPVGAACTLVFEAWQRADLTHKLEPGLAELLAAGILDNTLNFRAAITKPRDKAAYQKLLTISGKDETWAATYFSDCQAAIEADLAKAIRNDTKTFGRPGMPRTIGQLVIWDASKLVADKRHELDSVTRTWPADWSLNLLSISEGRNYFLADAAGQAKIKALTGVPFANNLAQSDRLWLRKELLKQAEITS